MYKAIFSTKWHIASHHVYHHEGHIVMGDTMQNDDQELKMEGNDDPSVIRTHGQSTASI